MTGHVQLGWRTVRWGGWSVAYRRAVAWRTGAVLILALGVAGFSLTVGAITVEPAELWQVLTGGGDDLSRLIVLEWRLPRIVTALVAGAALGISGAFVQTITRNPLGSPDVIGFSAGSYLGVLVVVVALNGQPGARGVGAVVGGLVSAALVWALSWRRGVTGFRLIIVGIGVSTMLTGLATWLTLVSSEEEFKAFVYWSAGSLDSLTWPHVTGPLLVMALVLGPSLLLGSPLRQLELGDAGARSRGVRVELVRAGALGCGILLVAMVTATCGPIEFVALAAPQIARRMTGSTSIGLVGSAAMGALLVLAADLLGDELLPVSLPVGVVTLVFGGAYLTVLLLRESRHR